MFRLVIFSDKFLLLMRSLAHVPTGIPVVVYEHYQVLKRAGDGAYGVVFKAQDKSKNNELVAIKKMSEAFRDPRDAKRILREIKLLSRFTVGQQPS